MMVRLSHSERLKAQNIERWNEMQAHRFVRDIKRNVLPDAVFANYLRYEHLFVETAITIFGYALVKAPDLASKRWLAGVLHALATEQIPYFEAVFDALDVKPLSPDDSLPDHVRAFNYGMLEIAEKGSFHDVIVAMMCAEWMYADWCAEAGQVAIANQSINAWVLLHTDETFRKQALWLRHQIDSLPDAQFDFEQTNAVFAKALALEIDFHSAAYE
ncbi:TenA family protein [Paraburkholderia xenovorans]|uniref:TenA family protein n=1 Tax=Paraburkholderia xenovorans TaxID=36873 RepID=UPI0038BA0363